MPFCDPTLSYDARIDDMLKRMTKEEKLGNLQTSDAAAIPSLGLLKYNWWSEATCRRAIGVVVAFHRVSKRNAVQVPEANNGKHKAPHLCMMILSLQF